MQTFSWWKRGAQKGVLSVGADMLLPSPHSCLPLLNESSPPGLTICQPSLPQRACEDYQAAVGECHGTLEEGRCEAKAESKYDFASSYLKGNFNDQYQSAKAYRSVSEIIRSAKAVLPNVHCFQPSSPTASLRLSPEHWKRS